MLFSTVYVDGFDELFVPPPKLYVMLYVFIVAFAVILTAFLGIVNSYVWLFEPVTSILVQFFHVYPVDGVAVTVTF